MVNTDLNELNPMIWPDSARRSDFGELTIGGVGVRALVEQYGSPLFVFDEEHVRNRARNYVKAFNTAEVPTDVYYASKAFLSVKVAKWLAEEGLGIDVCTAGELEVALRAGVNPSRILFHGNNKSVAELEKAVEVGVGRIVVDSLIEIQRLDQIATRNGITQQVLVRLTLGVEAHTHEAISTAHEDQKFGLSIASGAALDAVESVIAAPALNLLGLHSHIGSQIFDASGFEIAAHRIVSFANQVRERFDFTVTELNVGGGMGIAYVPSDDPLNVEHMAKAIHDIITSECSRTNFPLPRLAVEPGRAIIGSGAVTVYEIGTVKPVDVSDSLVRNYISVDGGISDNIRTALYDAQYTVAIASRESTGVPVTSRVVGKHCESGDIVVRDTELPADLVPGDLLAVAATGAYCRAMASNYNYLPKPAVISTKDGKSQVLLRRETIEDLLALDAGITN